MKKYLLLLWFTGLILTACAAPADSPLVGSWLLTAYGPKSSPTPAVTDSGAMLVFKDDGTMAGNSGCNGFGGEYTVEGDQINFGEIVSTLMACDDPIMAQEGANHKVLTGSATFQIEGNTLTLTNDDMVLVFTAGSYL